jgi:hypothetical protein
MAEPVRARRLSDEEGRRLQQIVGRDKHEVGPGPPRFDHHGVGIGDVGAAVPALAQR